jgi:hypothetical protein
MMEATVLRLRTRGLGLVLLAAAAAALAGCASSSSGRQPVGFAGGGDCLSVRAELRQLDGQGVPGMIQARQASGSGASGNPKIDRYNYLLEQYLGNNCQLPPGH